MSDLKTWAKAILIICSDIDRYEEDFNRAVMKIAMQRSGSTDALYQRMADAMDRKKGILNIKVIADTALKGIKKKLRKILTERFIERKHIEEISVLNDISIRNVSYSINRGLEDMAAVLQKEWTAEKLNNEYGADPIVQIALNGADERLRGKKDVIT